MDRIPSPIRSVSPCRRYRRALGHMLPMVRNGAFGEDRGLRLKPLWPCQSRRLKGAAPSRIHLGGPRATRCRDFGAPAGRQRTQGR
jgi:hypothetical protein